MDFKNFLKRIVFSESYRAQKYMDDFLEKEAKFIFVAESCKTLEQLKSAEDWWIRRVFEIDSKTIEEFSLAKSLMLMRFFKNRRDFARDFINKLRIKINESEKDTV